MSQRLRQPCLSSLCWAKKPGGSPALPPASAQLSWWTNQSSSTMSHSCGHILSFFLSFFSFFDFLSCCFTMGTARERAFCLLTMPGVSWTSPYMYSAKKAASGHLWLPLYKHMATGIHLQHHRFRPQKWCHNMFLQQMMSQFSIIHSFLLETVPATNYSIVLTKMQRTPNLQCTLFYINLHLNVCNTSKFNYKKCWKGCIKLSALDSSLLQLGGCNEPHLAAYALISPEVYIQTLVHWCFKNLIRINVCLMLEMFCFFSSPLNKCPCDWSSLGHLGAFHSTASASAAIKQLNRRVCVILGHFLGWFLVLFTAKRTVRQKKDMGDRMRLKSLL